MNEQIQKQHKALADIFLTSPQDWEDMYQMVGPLVANRFEDEPYRTYEAVFLGAAFRRHFRESGDFQTIDGVTQRIREAARFGNALRQLVAAMKDVDNALSPMKKIYAAESLQICGQHLRREALPFGIDNRHGFQAAAAIVDEIIDRHFESYSAPTRAAMRMSIRFDPNSPRLIASP